MNVVEGPLPFPRDRFSWLVAFILFLALLTFYYSVSFSPLEEAYHSAFWYSTGEKVVSDDRSKDAKLRFSVKVASPRFISSQARHAFLISVTNKSTQPLSLELIPVGVLKHLNPEIRGNNLCTDATTAQASRSEAEKDEFVFFSSIAPSSAGDLAGNGTLSFRNIPPNANATGEVELAVLNVAEGTICMDWYLKILANYPKTPEDYIDKTASTLTEFDSQLKLFLEPEISIKVDPLRTVTQNIISFVLLPPWANGFIPLIAIFAVYLFDLDTAKKLGYTSPWLWLFVILLFIETFLFVYFATLLANAVMQQADSEQLLLSQVIPWDWLAVLLIVGLAVWFFDKVIQDFALRKSEEAEVQSDIRRRQIGAR